MQVNSHHVLLEIYWLTAKRQGSAYKYWNRWSWCRSCSRVLGLGVETFV